jgi:hypothetical protein
MERVLAKGIVGAKPQDLEVTVSLTAGELLVIWEGWVLE